MQLQGFVRNTQKRQTPPSKKPGKNFGKSFTVYDAELHADDGSKVGISFGFDQPEVGEGDYVKFDAFDKNGYLQVDQSTIERLEAPAAPVAAQPAAASGGAAPAADSSSGNYAVKEYGYKTHPEDAKRITYASANTRAIELATLLLAYDALPHSKAKGKGGEAQRYEELMAAVDKITVKLFNDSMSLRTLDVVADEGVISTKPSSDLPADAETDKQGADALDD